MANTKIQFKYGQWSQTQGLTMAKEGVVVFSGLTKEIYVDGKVFATNVDVDFTKLKERVTTLEDFREAMRVAGYEQATMTTTTDASSLTIYGIKQGEGAEGANDGKIAHDTTNDLTINFEGVYDGTTNKVATQSTVKTAVDNLRTEILGSGDLQKTLDTIKEIQAVLIEGTWKVIDTDGNEHSASHVTLKEETTIGTTTYPAGAQIWTDGTDPVTDATVYAYQLTESSDIVKSEGIAEVDHTEGLDAMVEDIKENTEAITKLNGDVTTDGSVKNTIANALTADLINVNENVDNDFVTAEAVAGTEYNTYTIGVNYGSFKTDHGNVMDAESEAFVNGIATVKAVQDYIEERLSWSVYEVSSESVASGINNIPGDDVTVDITNNAEMPDSLVIK